MLNLLYLTGVLSVLGCLVHAFVADREFRLLRPAQSGDKAHEVWVMYRAGWNMASIDLLFFGLLCLYTAYDPTEKLVFAVQIGAVYFTGYALAWLLTLAISKVQAKWYLNLGQWAFLGTLAATAWVATLV